MEDEEVAEEEDNHFENTGFADEGLRYKESTHKWPKKKIIWLW